MRAPALARDKAICPTREHHNNMPRVSNKISVIQRVLDSTEASITEIVGRGRDGSKYKIIYPNGDKYFCRVREVSGPYEKFDNQEFEILSAVNSEHVLKPIKSILIDGYHVLVTPFVDGVLLSERLASSGLSDGELLSLSTSLLDAVTQIELVGAVHLDIKPENIMIDQAGSFILLDFGAARLLRLMRDERLFPTRRYIPPEVLKFLFEPIPANRLQISSRSDVYSVGGVLYYAATHHGLSEYFRSSNDVLRIIPPPITDFNQSIDPRLSNLITRMLLKAPGERPSPEEASTILSGGAYVDAERNLPVFLLKYPPKELTSMVPALENYKNLTGVFWNDDSNPVIKGRYIPPLLWELSSRFSVSDSLKKQWQYGVYSFVVSGDTLCNPFDAEILQRNLSRIDEAITTVSSYPLKKDILVVINLDEALLISETMLAIQAAYVPKNISGIILRLKVPSAQFVLNDGHLEGIKRFVEPWLSAGKQVYFDGDISVIPIMHIGITGFIASTFPKLALLDSVPTTSGSIKRKPDGMFINYLFSMLPEDTVLFLIRSKPFRHLMNCGCDACSRSLLFKKGKFWDRGARRYHFVHIMAMELPKLKGLSKGGLIRSINSAIEMYQSISRSGIFLLPKYTEHIRRLITWRIFLER